MTSLKQVQTPQQTIQETEKKIKKAKKLEKILLGGGVLGVGLIIAGYNLNNETLGEYLTIGGFLGGFASSLSAYSKILDRKILQGILDDDNPNNEDDQGYNDDMNSDYQYNPENKFNDGYK